MDRGRIVVGTDGSDWSVAAVRWAAEEAGRRGATLHVVYAHEWDWPGARFGDETDLKARATERARDTTATAVAQAREAAPDVEIEADTKLGSPAPVLIDAAGRAELVVIGNRGRGGFGSLLLGSVSQRVATHAPCPVTVVRGRRDVLTGPVVVGVDGSTSSLEALEHALGIAARQKCDVVAVRTFALPTTTGDADLDDLVFAESGRDAAELEALNELLTPWRREHPGVGLTASSVRGSAAGVLVGMSHTARLVVVGSRGHGGVAGTLIGSVGLQLVHHADCPVLIVRPPGDAAS